MFGLEDGLERWGLTLYLGISRRVGSCTTTPTPCNTSSPQISIGTAQTATELAEVAALGFKSLLDLCAAAEPKKVAAAALPAALHYQSLPISPQTLHPALLADFAAALETLPAPVYVRCASGLRAGVLTLLSLAKREQWSLETYLEARDRLGLSHRPDCPLADFATAQLQA